MVATAAMIAQVSEFTVGGSGTSFTPDLFTALSAIAKSILDEDDPGFPASVYDYCHALLIAHLYAVKRGQTGYQSQSGEGYTVQRKVGETAYLHEYREMLKRWETGGIPTTPTETLVERADATMTGLQLDDAEIPSFFSEG